MLCCLNLNYALSIMSIERNWTVVFASFLSQNKHLNLMKLIRLPIDDGESVRLMFEIVMYTGVTACEGLL